MMSVRLVVPLSSTTWDSVKAYIQPEGIWKLLNFHYPLGKVTRLDLLFKVNGLTSLRAVPDWPNTQDDFAILEHNLKQHRELFIKENVGIEANQQSIKHSYVVLFA